MAGIWEGLTGMLAGAGGAIEKDPEKFAIIADLIGSNLDPSNPFAGVGQKIGASSLANKARIAQQKQLSDLLAGTTADSSVTPTSGAPGSGLSLLGGLDLSMFTDASQAGPTSLTLKAQPDGSQIATTNATVQTPATMPNVQGVNLTDVIPFSNALAGGSTDLTGLDPVLIARIMDKDFDIAGLQAANVASLSASAIEQQKDLVKQQQFQQSFTQQQQLNESLIQQRAIQSKKTELETRLAEATAPNEAALLQGELAKLNLGLEETGADIQGKQLANIEEIERQQLVQALSGDVKPDDLSTRAKLALLGPKGTTTLKTAGDVDVRLRQEAAAKAQVKKTETAYKALASLNAEDATVESNIAAVEQWNTNSPDDSSFGYFTGTEDPWGPGNDERGKQIKLDLPTGMTMGWVRENAATLGISVNDALKQLRNDLRKLKGL